MYYETTEQHHCTFAGFWVKLDSYQRIALFEYLCYVNSLLSEGLYHGIVPFLA